MGPGPDADGFVSASTPETGPGRRYLVAVYRDGVFVGWMNSNVMDTHDLDRTEDTRRLLEWIGVEPPKDVEEARRNRLAFEIWEREVREQVT